MTRKNDRARDELILDILRLRNAGMTSAQIGARFGITSSAVRTLINRVEKDMIQ